MVQLKMHVQLTNLKGEKSTTSFTVEENTQGYTLADIHSHLQEDAIAMATRMSGWRRSQITHARVLAA